MKRTFLCFLSAVLLCAQVITPAAAGGEKVITLQDGSVLRGEVAGFSDGVYTVRTSHMGTLEIADSDIRQISSADNAPAAGQPASSPQNIRGQMQQMQQTILADSEMVNEIMALSQDPAMMELLNDPSLLNAAMRYDLEAIQNHPKFQQLMGHPQMKRLIDKAGQKTGVTTGSQPSPSQKNNVIYYEY